MSLKTSESVTDVLKLFAECNDWLAHHQLSAIPVPKQQTVMLMIKKSPGSRKYWTISSLMLQDSQAEWILGISQGANTNLR